MSLTPCTKKILQLTKRTSKETSCLSERLISVFNLMYPLRKLINFELMLIKF